MQFIATKIYLFFNANFAKNHRITLFYKSISTTDCQHLTTQQYNIYHKDVGIISFTPINSKHFVFQQNITIFVHTRGLTDHTNFYYCRCFIRLRTSTEGLTDHTNFYYCRFGYFISVNLSLTDHTNFYYCR